MTEIMVNSNPFNFLLIAISGTWPVLRKNCREVKILSQLKR